MRTRLSLAVLYRKLNDIAPAIEHLKILLEMDSTNPNARKLLDDCKFNSKKEEIIDTLVVVVVFVVVIVLVVVGAE